MMDYKFPDVILLCSKDVSHIFLKPCEHNLEFVTGEEGAFSYSSSIVSIESFWQADGMK